MVKGVILAGGYGKRLRPLTEDKPKVLVEINNIPILDYILNWFHKNNIYTIYALAGYKGNVLLEYVQKYSRNVRVIIEEEPLGTAGAIKNAQNFLENDDFVVINGDILTNLKIYEMVEKMKKFEPIGVIATVPAQIPYGIVYADEQERIIKFEEKPLSNIYKMNAGVYLFSPEIFEYLPAKGMLETDVFPKLAKMRRLYRQYYEYVMWKNIETVKDVEEAEKLTPYL